LAPVMAMGFNVQPTRISARQGLHGDGVITEVGRRSQGHGVHIKQG